MSTRTVWASGSGSNSAPPEPSGVEVAPPCRGTHRASWLTIQRELQAPGPLLAVPVYWVYLFSCAKAHVGISGGPVRAGVIGTPPSPAHRRTRSGLAVVQLPPELAARGRAMSEVGP